MSKAKPAVILAAHGERGGAGDNERLQKLADDVAAAVPHADVGWVLVNEQDAVPRCLAEVGESPTVLLPLLFSDGFFHQERLRPHVVGSHRRLADVLAFWPEFPVFLADNLAHRLAARLVDPRVVLIAHGSSKSRASAEAAGHVAAALQDRFGQVTTAFLEEAPFAADVLEEADPPYAMIGLFFGAGMHGAEDFSRLAANAPNRPAAKFTVGELPGFADLVTHKALQELAKLEAG